MNTVTKRMRAIYLEIELGGFDAPGTALPPIGDGHLFDQIHFDRALRPDVLRWSRAGNAIAKQWASYGTDSQEAKG